MRMCWEGEVKCSQPISKCFPAQALSAFPKLGFQVLQLKESQARAYENTSQIGGRLDSFPLKSSLMHDFFSFWERLLANVSPRGVNLSLISS